MVTLSQERQVAFIWFPSRYFGEIWYPSLERYEWRLCQNRQDGADAVYASGVARTYWEAYQSILEIVKLWLPNKIVEVSISPQSHMDINVSHGGRLDLDGQLTLFR